MIYTVTLNPALDNTIILDKLTLGHVNRSKKSIVDVGGKGINVSKVIKSLEGESTTLGFLGNENKHGFIKYLEGLGIRNDFVFVEGETRTNIKIVEEECNVYTDINQRGFSVTEKDIEKIVDKLSSLVKEKDIVVLSGSLPSGIDDTIYEKLIGMLNSKDVITLLDAEGSALKKGLAAKPAVIKPNINELKNIYNFNSESIGDIMRIAREIIDSGVKMVVVSMGDNGSLYVDSNKALRAHPISVDVKSTVGAGDSMVAGLVYGLSMDYSTEDIFKFGVACGTSKVAKEGSKPPSRDEIYSMLGRVVIEEIK